MTSLASGTTAVSVVVANNMVMEAEPAHVLQTCKMLAAFAAIGCHVTYCWPWFGKTVPALAALPINLQPIRCWNRYGRARYAEFTARLLPRLARLPRDTVVMTRSLGVAAAGQSVARRLVLELHQDLAPLARRLMPLLGARIRWVAISGALRDHLIDHYRLARERVAACHDGVDYDAFALAPAVAAHERPLPAQVSGPVHLYYGTLRPERGLNLIAHAARALPGHGFVLIGGTQAEAGAAQSLGLALPNVVILPTIPHHRIPGLVRAYDSVLLPYTRAVSTHRWMSPLKLFEVLASGTPAVVSRLGPITEVVGAEQVAFLDCDRPDSLVEALAALERDPAAARRRAEAGQRLVAERHTWEGRARAILDLGLDLGVAP